jgi:uncharacterized repeat protein (TIGR03943 family)
VWLALAGGALALLGVSLVILAWRRGPDDAADGDVEEDAHGHHSGRVGWLLALPVAVAIVVGSNPLGSYAAGRQNAQRVLPPGEFHLDDYLEAGSFGGQAPALRLVDFVRAAQDEDDRALLAETPVRLTGFVAEDDFDGHRPGDVLLTRFMIGCCAADALAVQVRVPTEGDPPDLDTWIEVEGTLDLERSPGAGESLDPPVLAVRAIRDADRPDDVYEYP